MNMSLLLAFHILPSKSLFLPKTTSLPALVAMQLQKHSGLKQYIPRIKAEIFSYSIPCPSDIPCSSSMICGKIGVISLSHSLAKAIRCSLLLNKCRSSKKESLFTHRFAEFKSRGVMFARKTCSIQFLSLLKIDWRGDVISVKPMINQ